MSNLYWHFLPDDGCLRFGTREKVEVGKMLTLPEGVRPIPCTLGFHASERAVDALSYAPGGIICQVSLHGEIIPRGNPIDKHVGWGRMVVSMANADNILREFARWCALSVIDLWEPEQVVVDYLNTGDERIKEAASARASAYASAYASAVTAQNKNILIPSLIARYFYYLKRNFIVEEFVIWLESICFLCFMPFQDAL